MSTHEEEADGSHELAPGFMRRLLLLFALGGISSYFVYAWITHVLEGLAGGPGWRVGLPASLVLIFCIRGLARLLST